MEVKGVVHKILEPVSGTSARGEWKKQDVVIEQPGEYPKMVCLTFWGERADEAGNLKEGQNIEASINIESREYEGRWYTDIRAWRFSVVQEQQSAPNVPPMPSEEAWGQAPQGGAGSSSASKSDDDSFDDLPF